MALPITPNPFPVLRSGLSLGAPSHQGFCAAWNWMADILKKASDYFVLGINGKHGEISIVGGDRIQISTSGDTITINVSDDNEEDSSDEDSGGTDYEEIIGDGGGFVYPSPEDTPSPGIHYIGNERFPTPTPTPSPGGGSGGYGGDGGDGGFGGTAGFPIPAPTPSPGPVSSGGGGGGGDDCNKWNGDGVGNDGGSEMDNSGDNCSELNGW